jgi:hypothetical protein
MGALMVTRFDALSPSPNPASVNMYLLIVMASEYVPGYTIITEPGRGGVPLGSWSSAFWIVLYGFTTLPVPVVSLPLVDTKYMFG